MKRGGVLGDVLEPVLLDRGDHRRAAEDTMLGLQHGLRVTVTLRSAFAQQREDPRLDLLDRHAADEGRREAAVTREANPLLDVGLALGVAVAIADKDDGVAAALFRFTMRPSTFLVSRCAW